MPGTAEFYSIDEAKKPAVERVYHNNDTCLPGRDIKASKADRSGTNGYGLCYECGERNKQGR